MCLYPRLVTNPKYKPNKKNGGKIPPIHDNRLLLVPIGCGKCMECIKKKAREWQIRLLEETKKTPHAYFVTLTFSDASINQLSNNTTLQGYPLDNYIATTAVRLFLERWRKTYHKSLKHWLITELGHKGTQNLHLHGIIWTQNNQQIHELHKHWQYGYIWPRSEQKQLTTKNYVNAQTIAYIIKYITKTDLDHKYYKPIILTSPGIGKNYTDTPNAQRNKFKIEGTNETYKTQTGHQIALPIYYRNKLYTENEREQLWIQKLDKQERYILGQKIDISQGLDNYKNALDGARLINQKLQYGTNQIDYNQKQYEEQARKLLQQTRKLRGRTPPDPPS